MGFYQELILELRKEIFSGHQLAKLKRDLALKYGLNKIPTHIEILLQAKKGDLNWLKKKLLTKPTRTISGVAPVAIMTKPFPCPHGKCIMCPGGPASAFGEMPQSYTGTEPATMRGIRNKFDPYLQVFNRLEQYLLLGHNCEKVELIVMGGTFPSFPLDYQEKFILYSLKAMNDFSEKFYPQGKFDFLGFKNFFELPAEDLMDQERAGKIQKRIIQLKLRRKVSLEKEREKLKDNFSLVYKVQNNKSSSQLYKQQKRNETAKIRCVALCIETRPDYGLLEQGNQMLRLGATRVELGIQSVYDDVLEKIQRGHTTTQTKESIRILKDLGFKVAGHYMPGLPGTNTKMNHKIETKKDLEGMKKLFSDPDYRPDMLKLYPCLVTKGTKLYDEYKQGKFKPLDAKKAAELIVKFKKFVPEYCRIMRVQRDIPTQQIAAGVEMTNLRQYLHQNYKVKCRCIRCREPKDEKINWNKVKIKIQEYSASGGKEFFISAEDTEKDLLVGFLRMRFPSQCLRAEITPKTALIRELHVYGTAAGIGEEGLVQHHGLGKKLLQTAERLAKSKGKSKLVIISGVGVREYYRKLGYALEGPYMMKRI